jgi:hypothetical protein
MPKRITAAPTIADCAAIMSSIPALPLWKLPTAVTLLPNLLRYVLAALWQAPHLAGDRADAGCIVENEGQPDVVQLSGGEPTVHPQFFEILDIAKTKPIKHLMLNTNGIRIAKDENL